MITKQTVTEIKLRGRPCPDASGTGKIIGMRFLGLTISRDEWPSGLYSLRQVTEVKLGRVRSNSGWVISEA